MSESKLKKANEKIAEEVTGGFKTIEDGVVGGYKKIEESVVGTYKKVEDAFVDQFLTHEGESVEDAKKRLSEEQVAREKTTDHITVPSVNRTDIGKASVEASRARGKASVEASKNAGKH